MVLNKQIEGKTFHRQACLALHFCFMVAWKNAKKKVTILHATVRMSFPNVENLEKRVQNACHTLESLRRITEFSHLTLKLSLFFAFMPLTLSLHDNHAASLILVLLLLLLFLKLSLTTLLCLLLLLFCFPGHSFRSVPWKGDSRSWLRQIASYYRRMFAQERLPGTAFILSGLNIRHFRWNKV